MNVLRLMRRREALIVAGTLLLAFLIPVARAADHHVTMTANGYNPPEISVDPGDTVVWTNEDPETHSVVGPNVDSPDIAPGQTFTHAFAEKQTFNYSCRFHPYMEAVVKVGAPGAAANPAAPSVPPGPVASAAPTAPPSPTPIAPASRLPDPPVGDELGDGTRLAAFTVEKGVKVFRLRMAPMQLEVAPNVVRQAFAFNGVVPGPVIRVNEGDRVRFIVRNDLPVATGVHWHGMILANEQDGVPHVTQHPIEPTQTFTYEWTAVATGTHWYHSHSGGSVIGKGLYGMLEIVPREGDIESDRDYRVLIGDTDLGFVFNGKSFPMTKRLAARVGERVRIRLVGTGDLLHTIHLHGSPFELVAQDGIPLPEPVGMDTLTVGPGQTFDIVAVPINTGPWLFHCHIFDHSETDQGMTGLVTILDVGPSVKQTAATAKPPNVIASGTQTGLVAEQGATASARSGVPFELTLLSLALIGLAGRSVVRARRRST